MFLSVILLVAPFFPETPRHLTQTGRLEDARQVLTRCRLLATEESVNQDLEEIKAAIRLEATQASHGFISTIWKKDVLHTRRRVALAMGIHFMRELTGPDVIAVFGPQVFALSGCRFHSPKTWWNLLDTDFELYFRFWGLAINSCWAQLYRLYVLNFYRLVHRRTLREEEIVADRLVHHG